MLPLEDLARDEDGAQRQGDRKTRDEALAVVAHQGVLGVGVGEATDHQDHGLDRGQQDRLDGFGRARGRPHRSTRAGVEVEAEEGREEHDLGGDEEDHRKLHVLAGLVGLGGGMGRHQGVGVGFTDQIAPPADGPDQRHDGADHQDRVADGLETERKSQAERQQHDPQGRDWRPGIRVDVRVIKVTLIGGGLVHACVSLVFFLLLCEGAVRRRQAQKGVRTPLGSAES
ncbi:hypothetical protein D3C86_1577270 [compost metagenome]